MTRLLKYIAVTLLSVLLLFLLLFKPIEKIPYQKWEAYKETKQAITKTIIQETTGDKLYAGWAKENITPTKPSPIAAYGLRNNFSDIHDSLYITAFALSNGLDTAFLVTTDLLIFPPTVSKALKDSLGLDKFNKIYLTATHTHSGAGGWMKGLAARFIAGSYNKEYVQKITTAVIKALAKAETRLDKVHMQYGEVMADAYIRNRVKKGGIEDSLFRYITLKNTKGHKAIITSFSAHANCLSSKDNQISGDYPYILRDSLEHHGYEVAAFMAGAVGSMTNVCGENYNYACAAELANGLFTKIDPSNQKKIHSTSIAIGKIPIFLKAPGPNLYHNWTIRPYVFDLLMGTQETYIEYLKLGDLLLLGMPCDFSGVLAIQISQQEKKEGKTVFFTSFNGGYIGYITPDNYSSIDNSETRSMNWYGPYSGSYMREITKDIINKF